MQKKLKEAAQLIIEARQTGGFHWLRYLCRKWYPLLQRRKWYLVEIRPSNIRIHYFHTYPQKSWEVIKEIFYDFFGVAKFNRAHEVMAVLEERGLLKGLTTQNIDNLHQEAGSKTVYEFHGNSKKLVCTECDRHFDVDESIFNVLPPFL